MLLRQTGDPQLVNLVNRRVLIGLRHLPLQSAAVVVAAAVVAAAVVDAAVVVAAGFVVVAVVDLVAVVAVQFVDLPCYLHLAFHPFVH